jgi:serine phosphatase RsbU (regulator of sigma subunit)
MEVYNRIAPFFFEFRGLTSGATVLVIIGLLFRDQRRIGEERALLAGEMQAAREIQPMLAPEILHTALGVSVRVAFHPVREVGGDFYQCRALEGGRQRLLIGDVSGKGTAAAMTATLLLGGAEDQDSLTPGELLNHLDRVLQRSRVGGFATCICCDLDADGTVTVANAGHLSPYCSGQEVPTAAALPLGIAAGTVPSYEQSSFVLRPGDTLTFLSDGVVEARDASGELFGFERARLTSTRPAE